MDEPAKVPRVPWREAMLLALWLLATIGWRPLMVPDEGRYAGVALEMLHGDALVPTLNGLPFFHKPPLLYGLDMAAMQVLGIHEFAVRLGPAIGAFVLGMALFLHLRRWHGLASARTGLAVLATTPFFFLGGQFVNHDMGVAGCITAAIVAAVRAFDSPECPRSTPWLVLAWVFVGLGVLAKGLIGVVLPGLVVVPWLAAQRRWRDLAALLHPLGLLAFALVALPWLWAMQARYPGFLDYFIVEQHFRRFSQAGFNNVQPPWFFIWALPAVTLPWSLWLWPAGRRAALAVQRQGDARAGLYIWWVIVVVGFFSLPQSKLVGYVLPALAPWCAMIALAMTGRARRVRVLTVLAAVLCVTLVGAIAWKAPKSQRETAHELARRLQPGDQVAFVSAYPYDVTFYARLREPVFVLSDWDDPELPKRDNWRKELHDAARFATPAQRRVLWPIARIDDLSCLGRRVWFVGAAADAATLARVSGATLVWTGPAARLWQAPARSCTLAPGP